MSAPSIVLAGSSAAYDDLWAALTITSQGSSAVTECGIVISLTATNSDPTIGGTGVTKLAASGTTGTQDVYAIGLTHGAQYTFKIFATNGTGTTYASTSTVTLSSGLDVPSMAGDPSAEVTDTGVVFRGNVTNANGYGVSARGFIYALTSVMADPELGFDGVTDLDSGNDLGRFTETETGLPIGAYSARTYAINSAGTAYSATFYFDILPPPLVTNFKRISTKPGPWSSPPTVMCLSKPVVETSPTGWDIMRERLWVPYSPFFAAGERRDHMLDARAQPFAHMLAQEERVVDFKGGFPVVELLSLGFAREKPWTIQTTHDSQGEVGSAGGVTRNLPTFTLTWFSESLADTKTVIPSPAVPPETFGWDAYSITTGLPNNVGFILIKRDVDPLPVINGSTPQAVTDAGGFTRANANLAPRPTLCKVVDYYVYDFTDTVPPGD